MPNIEELFQKHLISNNEHLQQFKQLVSIVSELQKKNKEYTYRTYMIGFFIGFLVSFIKQIITDIYNDYKNN